jgi:hypothetical protein
MQKHYMLALAVTMLMNAPVYALKLMSPQAVCLQRGLGENTPEWDACVQEVTNNNDRITREFYANSENPGSSSTTADYYVSQNEKNQIYGIDTGLVPPMMRKSLARKIQQNQRLFIPKPLK